MDHAEHGNEMGVEKMKEMLDMVSEKIPRMMQGLLDTVYSKETAVSMGQAVGTYYRELVAAGMPPEVAADMARAYTISVKDIISNRQMGMDHKDGDRA